MRQMAPPWSRSAECATGPREIPDYAALVTSLVVIVFYGAVKLLVYGVWCLLALTLAGFPEKLWRSVGMGLLRWSMGLALGLLLFFLVRPARADVVPLYFAIYVPVRALEWGLVSVLILPRGERWPWRRRLAWIGGGIVLSFVTDLASPDMIEHGRFCVGRCLG
jgi:hypothetical protein